MTQLPNPHQKWRKLATGAKHFWSFKALISHSFPNILPNCLDMQNILSMLRRPWNALECMHMTSSSVRSNLRTSSDPGILSTKLWRTSTSSKPVTPRALLIMGQKKHPIKKKATTISINKTKRAKGERSCVDAQTPRMLVILERNDISTTDAQSVENRGMGL